jgi:hypothetical protein
LPARQRLGERDWRDAYEQKAFAHLGQTSRRVTIPHLQGENLRVSLWFDVPKVTRQRLQTINEKLWLFLSTTCVEKVADLMVTYADSPSSIFIGYHTLFPGVCLRFQAN